MQSSISQAPDLAGLIHGILLYGNIAVKAAHIRLLAFAEPGNRASLAIGSIAKRGLTDLLRRTSPRINRFAARRYCVLACDRSTGEDQVPVEIPAASRHQAATGSDKNYRTRIK
jgi:hypothetical protein